MFDHIQRLAVKNEAEKYLTRLISSYKNKCNRLSRRIHPTSDRFSKELKEIYEDHDRKWRDYADERSRQTGYTIVGNAFGINVMAHIEETLK